MKPLKIMFSNLKKDALHNIIMIVFVALSVFFMDITLSELMHMNYINNAVKGCGLYEEYIYAAPPAKRYGGNDNAPSNEVLWSYEREALERFKKDGVIQDWFMMNKTGEPISLRENSDGELCDRAECYYYPRELANEMSFPLSRGKWFDKYDADDDIPPIIVGSDFAGRFKVGKVVSLYRYSSNEYREYRVIGVLRRNTMLLSLGAGGSGMDLNSCFDAGDECNGAIIFCEDEIDDPYSRGGVIIKVSEENKSRVFDELADIGYMFTFKELSDAAERNNSTLTEMQSVIFMLMMIVCIAGVSSGNLLSTIACKKKYAVYFMCGMEWKTGVLITLAESVVKLVIPAGIGYAMFLDWYSKDGYQSMRLTEANVIVTALFVGLIFLLTSLMPLLDIKKTAPVKIITEM